MKTERDRPQACEGPVPSTRTGPADAPQTSTEVEHTSTWDLVTIPRAEWRQMKVFADSWLRFWDSGALADLVDREVVARIRATSHDLSRACRWSVAVGPSHRELERRRRITSVLDCGTCGRAVEVAHPIEPRQYDLLPDTSWVRCAEHAEVAA